MPNRPYGAPFEATVELRGDCVVWTAGLSEGGYGRYQGGYAHLFAWEQANGPVPEGFQVHHRCHVRSCVLLDHLELKSEFDHKSEHSTRAYCHNGHELNEENCYFWNSSDGSHRARICRPCAAQRARRYRKERREAIANGQR